MMPSVRSLVERVNTELPPPDTLLADVARYGAKGAAAMHRAHSSQITYWVHQLRASAASTALDERHGTLPLAPKLTPAQQAALPDAIALWRRRYPNVFPADLVVDASGKTTWADLQNLHRTQRGEPRIPNRGKGYWWVQGVGLRTAAELAQGPA